MKLQSGWLESRVQDLLVHHDVGLAQADGLVELLKKGHAERVSDGGALCSEGEKADAIYVLLDGRVGVRLRDLHGRDHELLQLAAPALVGHIGMLDGAKCCGTYVALLPSVVVELPRAQCEPVLQQAWGAGATLRHLLISSMSQQLEARNKRLLGLMTLVGTQADSRPGPSRDRQSSWWKRMLRRDRTPAHDPEADVLEMAGLTKGWDVDTRGVNNITSTEDEAMKRSRLRRRT